MDSVFFQLAITLSLASVLGFIVLKLRLPLVVAYLLAGVALSGFAFFDTTHSFILNTLPEIGIALVLFLIGAELDFREVKSIGKPVFAAALAQVTLSSVAGYFIAQRLGFVGQEAMYLGLGLGFSSTVVIVKMLLEKRDIASLYGKLSIGILLVEDLIAIGALMMISVSSSGLHLGLQNSMPLLALAAKAIGAMFLAFILSRYVLERVFDSVAKSVELLFFAAITWCFVFTAFTVFLGFSIAIGAFIAGVAIASTSYHLQIQGKVKPLRDFFLTLFFVYLGSQVRIGDLSTSWKAVAALAGFALIAKPLIYMVMLGFFGFRKHTLFQTALNLTQISEFSLIILVVAIQHGIASPFALSIMAAASVISIIISSTLIHYSDRIYGGVKNILSIFEHRSRVHFFEAKTEEQLQDHAVVIGADKIGGAVVDHLEREGIPLVVVDFNPHIVQKLRARGIFVIYGDLSDPEILDNLQLQSARLVISTAAGIVDNQTLIEECRRKKSKAVIVVRAADREHEQILEDMGADYVILPERVSGDFLVSQLKGHWPNVKFGK